MSSKEVKFTWEKEYEDPFQLLKARLLQVPNLAFPNFPRPFVDDTDASEMALGANLSQINDGEERLIAFESRVSSKTEVNYATIEREALGIVEEMHWFRPWINGLQCIARTNYASLSCLIRQNADGMTFRMIQKLQERNCRIIHRPGENIVTRTDSAEDLKIGSSLKRKDADVKVHARTHIPRPAKCSEVWNWNLLGIV